MSRMKQLEDTPQAGQCVGIDLHELSAMPAAASYVLAHSWVP